MIGTVIYRLWDGDSLWAELDLAGVWSSPRELRTEALNDYAGALEAPGQGDPRVAQVEVVQAARPGLRLENLYRREAQPGTVY